MTASVPVDLWRDVQSLKPIVEEWRKEADIARRLPDAIGRAFVERDLYRVLLPRDFGGMGLNPLAQFDIAEEISSYDGSVGWNFAIGSSSGTLPGILEPETVAAIFTSAETLVAGSGPPQGRAVATEGGYRVTGRFAWVSGIHQAQWVLGGCFVFDGDQMRMGPHGGPVVVHALMPKDGVTVLDSWHTGGMRGTGSTEFEARDMFVPTEHALVLFGSEPRHPDPIFRLPTSFFGFGLTAVPLGIARATTEALKALALAKKPPPPRVGLSEQPFTQYVVARTEAMVEAARISVRDAFSELWRQVSDDGSATMEARARLRRSSVHAVETSIEAVGMCYRAAGGTALFEDQAFERALRDVNAIGGHIVYQRPMMEDAGRVAMGLSPLLAMF